LADFFPTPIPGFHLFHEVCSACETCGHQRVSLVKHTPKPSTSVFFIVTLARLEVCKSHCNEKTFCLQPLVTEALCLLLLSNELWDFYLFRTVRTSPLRILPCVHARCSILLFSGFRSAPDFGKIYFCVSSSWLVPHHRPAFLILFLFTLTWTHSCKKPRKLQRTVYVCVCVCVCVCVWMCECNLYCSPFSLFLFCLCCDCGFATGKFFMLIFKKNEALQPLASLCSEGHLSLMQGLAEVVIGLWNKLRGACMPAVDWSGWHKCTMNVFKNLLMSHFSK